MDCNLTKFLGDKSWGNHVAHAVTHAANKHSNGAVIECASMDTILHSLHILKEEVVEVQDEAEKLHALGDDASLSDIKQAAKSLIEELYQVAGVAVSMAWNLQRELSDA